MLTTLEETLRKTPDDRATWLVYADALQEKGDARGDVIALGERLRDGERGAIEAKYAERCRAARWPRGAPYPRMHYVTRFEQMFAELRAHPEIEVTKADLTRADVGSDEMAAWRERAAGSWPEGMTELYDEVTEVELTYRVKDDESTGGAINIPSLSLWDHDALEDELWFDFTEEDSALHFIRPIDRFVPEAYAVLYLRPEGKPAEVAYHYCGEELVPTGLTYREWLDLLFRSRGVLYWLQLTLGPGRDKTWVGDGIERVAKLFPDFDPKSMQPKKRHKEIALD